MITMIKDRIIFLKQRRVSQRCQGVLDHPRGRMVYQSRVEMEGRDPEVKVPNTTESPPRGNSKHLKPMTLPPLRPNRVPIPTHSNLRTKTPLILNHRSCLVGAIRILKTMDPCRIYLRTLSIKTTNVLQWQIPLRENLKWRCLK